MFSIPGLKVISLTDAAAARIREIMRNGLGLDGGRRAIARGRDGRQNLFAQAEFGK